MNQDHKQKKFIKTIEKYAIKPLIISGCIICLAILYAIFFRDITPYAPLITIFILILTVIYIFTSVRNLKKQHPTLIAEYKKFLDSSSKK